jgi:hypothetical protein
MQRKGHFTKGYLHLSIAMPWGAFASSLTARIAPVPFIGLPPVRKHAVRSMKPKEFTSVLAIGKIGFKK